MKDLITKVKIYLQDNTNEEITTGGVSANINAWHTNKSGIVEYLKTLDNYSAKDYAIIKDYTLSVKMNVKKYLSALYNLIDVLNDAKYNASTRDYYISKYAELFGFIYNNIYSRLKSAEQFDTLTTELKSDFINIIQRVDTLKNIRVKNNILKAVVLAISEALKDIKNVYNISESAYYTNALNNFTTYEARALEALASRKESYTLLISANPLDYVSMSRSNYFNSCHNIESGCYRQGCLSYMNDSASLIVKIFKTEALKDINNIHTSADFIGRAVVSLNDSACLISRFYPIGETQQQLIDDIRKNILSALNFNVYKVFEDMDDLNAYGVDVYSYGAHYRDYNAYSWSHDGGIRAYAIHEHKRRDLEIGADAYCLTCGDMLDCDEEEAITCCHYVYCQDCGNRIYRGDAVEIDGDFYCEDCVGWCERCEEYHRREDMHEFDGDDLCADCIRDLL